MFWTYLDYWIYVTIILKQNNMFSFLNKKFWKTVKFEFQIFILTTRSKFFSHGQNFLNDMNNKWCKGKHFPTIIKVSTREKSLRLLNSEEFQNSCYLIRHNIADLGNVTDLGNWSGLIKELKPNDFE